MVHNSDMILVFIGQTGSGKSTAINYFANYFMGTGFSQQSGYSQVKVVIPNKLFPQALNGYSHSERNVFDNTMSQTTRCNTYNFTSPAHNNMRITVVDTPGFNDTNQNHDDANIQEILKTLASLPFISGIVVTINGTMSRLVTSFRTSLNQLRGSLPDSIFNNLFFIFTNCVNETRSVDIKILDEYRPKIDCIFHMQNSLFSAESINDVEQDPRKRRRAEEQWQDSMETIGELMQKIRQTTPVSTKVFADMRIKREQLVAHKTNLLAKQKSLLSTRSSLNIERQRLSNAQNSLWANQNYQQNKTIETIEMDRRSYYSTICTQHARVSICHENCGLAYQPNLNFEHFKNCAAADSTTRNCRVCGCNMSSHYHTYEIPVTRYKSVQEIDHGKKAAYDSASQQVSMAQSQIQYLDNTCRIMENEVNQYNNGILQSIRDLKQICSHFNFSEEMATTIEALRQEARIAPDLNAKQEYNNMASAIEALLTQLR